MTFNTNALANCRMKKMKRLLLTLWFGFAAINTALAGTDVQPSITTANGEFVYKYLLGEIAGQRGDLSLSGQLFLDLAQKTRDPRLAERAAKVAAYGRNQKITLDAATLWVELDPDSLEAQQASSQMLASAGEIKRALPHIKQLLTKEDARAVTFLFLNDLFMNQKDKKESLATVQSLAKPYPDLAEAHFAIAQAAWTAEEMELAKKEIQTANALRPDWEVAAQMQAQMMAKASPDEAATFYKGFLARNPNAHNARMDYAKLLVNLKRYTEAKPEFVKLVDADKENPETHAIVGLLSLEANQLDIAKQYLQTALDNGFKDPEQLIIYLGLIAERNEDVAKAIEWYKQVPQKNSHYLEAQLAIASVTSRSEGTDAAISLLNDLKELSPQDQMTVVQAQASLLARDKRHQEAFKLIEKTINSIPNTPQLIYDYAMAAERIGNLELMEKELRKVIQLQPDFAAAYNALGYSLADRHIQLNEAKTLIETAMKLSPTDHYVLDSLGWVEYRLGNHAVAIAHLRKAYEIQQDPEIAAHLGEVLWSHGQEEEAKKIWNKALEAFPENTTLTNTTKKFKS